MPVEVVRGWWRTIGPREIVIGYEAKAVGRQTMATAKWLKSCGASVFGGLVSSGGVGELGTSEVMGASTMPKAASENVPLTPVILKPWPGYLVSLAVPL